MSEKIFYRSATFKRAAIDEKARTIDLSFSSEEPCKQGGQYEILDHSPDAVDLSRLVGGPLLLEHDPKSLIGTVESAHIGADRKGRAVVRFGKGPLAEQTWQEVIDGLRSQISVGYDVQKTATGQKINGRPSVIATRWQPLELSSVAIAADGNVGIGRAHHSSSMKTQEQEIGTTSGDENADNERSRTAEILDIADMIKKRDHKDFSREARKAIAEGVSADEFSKAVVKSDRFKAKFIVGEEDESEPVHAHPVNDRRDHHARLALH